MKKKLGIFLAMAVFLLVSVGFAGNAYCEEGEGKGKIHFIEDYENDEDNEYNIPACEPYAPAGLDKAVIGNDDRIHVWNTSQWPYSAIALMEVEGECGHIWQSTGFLVGDTGLFLSAAHCLVCPMDSQWAKSIQFCFGYKNSKNIYYRYTGDWDAWVGNTFVNKEYSIEKDYAVLKIDKTVPLKVGWFGAYWGESDEKIEKYHAYVAGYRDEKLRYDSGYLTVMDADHVKFLMDEVSGNSGGPIYTSDGYAIGIIIAETKDVDHTPLFNVGYRLNHELWLKTAKYW